MSIDGYTLKALSVESVLNLLPDKKVYLLHADDDHHVPYIEYEEIIGQGADYAENKEIATEYSMQVDIFSKGNFIKIADAVMKAMTNAGFTRFAENELYEEDTQLFHKAFRFSISLENKE